MDQYIVSARKYRPESFGKLIGQDNIARTLKNSILRGQLAHAYLFCGPRGVGKTSTARIFAKMINCSHPTPDMEPCGECESCVSFAEGRSYSIHELDAASNNGVDAIKALMEQVQVPPPLGRYSVYIIDEVHMLSSAAFNAFLKTLEEPPAHAIFILATTEKYKIIPTILSRCQTYDFNRISVSDIVSNLREIASREGITIGDDSLHIIAQKADGAMRDALTIFDQTVAFCGTDIRYADVISNLNVLDHEYSFRIIDASLTGDYASSLLIFDEVLSKGFNAQYFISSLSSHLRDLVVSMTAGLDALLDMPESLKLRYKEQSSRCSLQFLYDALGIMAQCEAGYRLAVNQRLHIEFALMKLGFIGRGPVQPDRTQSAAAVAAPAAAPAVTAASAPAAPAPASAPAAAPAVAPSPAVGAPAPAAAPELVPSAPAAARIAVQAEKPASAALASAPQAAPASEPQPAPAPAAAPELVPPASAAARIAVQTAAAAPAAARIAVQAEKPASAAPASAPAAAPAVAPSPAVGAPAPAAAPELVPPASAAAAAPAAQTPAPAAAPSPAVGAPAAAAAPSPAVGAPAAAAAPSSEPAPPKPRRRVAQKGAALSMAAIGQTTGDETENPYASASKAVPPLDDESVAVHWAKLSTMYPEYPRLAVAMSKTKLTLSEEDGCQLLTFTVTSEAQKEWIVERVLHDLELKFRKLSSNPSVRIAVDVPQYEEKKQIYTSEEKVKALVEKEPELKDLIVDLDLDVR